MKKKYVFTLVLLILAVTSVGIGFWSWQNYQKYLSAWSGSYNDENFWVARHHPALEAIYSERLVSGEIVKHECVDNSEFEIEIDSTAVAPPTPGDVSFDEIYLITSERYSLGATFVNSEHRDGISSEDFFQALESGDIVNFWIRYYPATKELQIANAFMGNPIITI